ncbi:MAG TPA: response regulator [Nitrospiraceae bacterium]|nr:response regulator [Nitrospiraceae bacterium]
MVSVEPLPPTQESRTILCVEDDQALRALLVATLQSEGFTVLQARESQEALQLCQRHPGPIQLLLTDFRLPSAVLQLAKDKGQRSTMHGLDLMRQVVALRPQIRVILMSGQVDEGHPSFKVLTEDMPLLLKPFSMDTLVRTVRRVLDTPAQS